MAKLNSEFLKDKELIFIGYSGKKDSFSKIIYKAFIDKGYTVYPVNNKADGSFDVKVYKDISELPKVPAAAFVLLNSNNTKTAVESLVGSGIKKVLFQNKHSVDEATLKLCSDNGIETAIGCPMMLLGSGLHKIHAFFAGVK
ncbi:MAG: CoA-binding protein [Bacillota bacterium]